MDHSIAYWDRIAQRYARQPIANEADYQKKLEVTQHYLKPDMRVLEFGCGTGSTALVHGPLVREYIATDLAPAMIEIANGKLAASGPGNLHFEVAALDDFTARRERFDGVLGLNVLHLMEDRDKAIEQVYQLLNPGGVFISSTACLKQGLNPYRFIAPFTRLFKLPLVKAFTRRELEQSLERVGFNIDYRWVPDGNPLVYFLVAMK
ncbi:MAG: SAM-dependent methyltransferase [Pseudomonadales bacterium]|nr:SAM-dependent methyltransferase [Pseudomonadales bacterium]